jgi:hypothetical protein
MTDWIPNTTAGFQKAGKLAGPMSGAKFILILKRVYQQLQDGELGSIYIEKIWHDK